MKSDAAVKQRNQIENEIVKSVLRQMFQAILGLSDKFANSAFGEMLMKSALGIKFESAILEISAKFANKAFWT